MSQRIREDGKLSEKMLGEQKKPGSVFSLDGWLTTKSYNGGKESAGEKVGEAGWEKVSE